MLFIVTSIKKLISSLTLCVIFSFFMHSAFAVELDGLYEAELLSESQDSSERELLFTKGLKEVLVKVSGNLEVLYHADIAASAEQDYKSFIERYSYGDEDSLYPDKFPLHINYSEEMVNKLLLDNGFKVWVSSRPLTLVWVAVGDDTSKTLINSDNDASIIDLFESLAAKKAVPITFPLLDLEDKTNINVNDIWEQIPGKIRVASGRYASDAVLSVKLHKSFFGQWYSSWQLLVSNKAYVWKLQGDDKEELINQGFLELTKNLLSAYAIESSNSNTKSFDIAVYGVREAKDYAKVMAYLNKLGTIRKVRLLKLKPERLVLNIEPVTDYMSVKRNIALDYIFENSEITEPDVMMQYVYKD